MAISSLVSIEVCPTVLVMNTVFIAIGMRFLFVDRGMMDRSVVDRSVVYRGMVDRGRVDRGRVVSSVVREVVGSGLGEKEDCEAQNKDLRMTRADNSLTNLKYFYLHFSAELVK